jgi:hypothetical protein
VLYNLFANIHSFIRHLCYINLFPNKHSFIWHLCYNLFANIHSFIWHLCYNLFANIHSFDICVISYLQTFIHSFIRHLCYNLFANIHSFIHLTFVLYNLFANIHSFIRHLCYNLFANIHSFDVKSLFETSQHNKFQLFFFGSFWQLWILTHSLPFLNYLMLLNFKSEEGSLGLMKAWKKTM